MHRARNGLDNYWKWVNEIILFICVFLGTVISDRPIITNLESGSSFIHVTWQPPKNAGGIPVTGYLVQAIDKNNPNKVLNCPDVTTSIFSCTINGLQANTTYVVRVKAIGIPGYYFSAHEKIITKHKGKKLIVISKAKTKLITLAWMTTDTLKTMRQQELEACK